MQKIEIVRGEEFKIAVKEEIDRDDIFVEEYKRAAVMLDEITGASLRMASGKKNGKKWIWKRQDFENNMIAFCGNRGEGKSSAMVTFVNAVYKMDPKKDEMSSQAGGIFSGCRNLLGVHFAEPILIDPSMFDDVHNVLDIVLAKIFRNFAVRYEQDNQYADELTRDRLVNQFQKVYRYVSLINNQKQMLDDEFDYEGNISKLSKLGESTNLKEELSKLIEMYLESIDGQEGNGRKGKAQMIIAIDDLDLCSSNAYKMAEQIRKYLIIPNVTIVISVKIDQLELCVREQNLRDFEKIYQNRDDEVYRQLNKEVQTMAERYVAKLIPGQRRIYLPKIQNLDEVHIVYREYDENKIIWDSRGEADSERLKDSESSYGGTKESSDRKGAFIRTMLELLHDRTGMRFRPEKNGHSYLFPNNLRDMVSWITMIAGMERAEGKEEEKRDEVYLKNIQAFEEYFEREWNGDNLALYDGWTLQEIGDMDTYHLHIAVRRILEKIYTESYPVYNPQMNQYAANRMDSFFHVMVLFEMCERDISDIRKEEYIYRLRSLYTMKMNRFLRRRQEAEMMDFAGGYIWGPSFGGVLPAHQGTGLDRSRFVMETVEAYNRIIEEINGQVQPLEVPEKGKPCYASRISGDEDRDDYIKVWIVLALFSNVCYWGNGPVVYASNEGIISDNSQVYNYVQISLENYLVGLCEPEALYDKVNMARLGIKEKEYGRIIDAFKRDNQEIIRCAREIISNIDLALEIKDYCTKKRNYKQKTENAVDLSRKLVETFFKNMEACMEQYGISCDSSKFLELSFEEEKIDIALLYAEIFELSVQNIPLREQQEEDDAISDYILRYRKRITIIPEEWNTQNYVSYHVSSSMRNLSAENAKMNLDDLASSIRQYNGAFRKWPESLDVEGLCSLYGEVMRIYRKNKKGQISREMHEEYKRLVKVQKEIEAMFSKTE